MPKITTTCAALAAVALLALAGCTDDTSDGAPDGAEYNQADVDYAGGMIAHHEQAVEMADLLLDTPGAEPAVIALAEDVKAAQGPEIEQMNDWLTAWDEHDPHADHGAMGHEGMMSDEDLALIEAADGPEASRLFLEQMIVHHEGAVSMAEEHLDDGQNPDALRLSENVVADQTAEIEVMRELLGDL